MKQLKNFILVLQMLNYIEKVYQKHFKYFISKYDILTK